MLVLLAALQAAAPPAEIVITGRGLAAAAGERAYGAVVIGRERLTDVASGRLEDVLRDAAGFQQFRRSDARSAQPTSQGATLRGLGGNASSRALLLLDGVPLSDPFGGYISFSAYDPERLGAIRVTRGGGSGVAGPGALAGTIELQSAVAGEMAPVWGAVRYGSRDSLEADLGLSGDMGGGFAFVSAGYSRGDGFVPIVAGQRGPVDFAAAYEQASLSARAVFPVADDLELQASGLAFTDRRDRGIPFTPNRTDGADASVRLIGTGAWGLEALAYVQMRSFASGFASVDAARTTATATLDQYEVPSTALGGRIELRPPLGKGVELRLGGDLRAAEGRTQELFQFAGGSPTRQRIAGGNTATLGAFAEASIDPTDALTLTAAGRIDRWWIRDGRLTERSLASGGTLSDTRFEDRAGWRPTARAGIAWRPADAVSLRGAAYLGWRLPTLNELYRPFRVGADAVAANDSLAPERLRGVDFGIDYRPAPGFRASATLFHNRLADGIANVTVARGPGTFPQVGFVSAAGTFRRRDNLDAVVSRGVELDGEARLGEWSLAGSYAYVDAEVRGSGLAAPLQGLRPAQVPKHQLSATLGWARERLRASATVRYVSAQFEDDLNETALDDALTLDAGLSLPLTPGLSLEARGENVTDRRVEAGISGGSLVERATPRTLWIGLRFGR